MRARNAFIAVGGIVFCVVLFLSGCQTAPAERIVFLKRPELLKKYDLVPFQKAWKEKGINLRQYTKIIVEPVILSQKLKKDELEKINLDSLLGVEKEQIMQFAKYTENAFKQAVRKDPRLTLVTKPGPNTLIIKLALVKVVPGKPLLGMVRNIPIPIGKAGFIISSSAKAAGLATDSVKGSVAIEGEFIDSQTRKVVAMFADRRSETPALVNFNSMSTFATPKEIVNCWAAIVVKCLGRKPGEKVEYPDDFKIINY